jgi:hypothetical protein
VPPQPHYLFAETDEPEPGITPFAEHSEADRDRAEELLTEPFREALAEYLAEMAGTPQHAPSAAAA